MKELIFVALSSFGAADLRPLDQLTASGHPFQIHSSGKRITQAEIIQHATEATIILAGIETYDSKVLTQLPLLKCISRCGVGQYGGTSGPDGMGIALRALCAVLEKAKVGYHLRDFDDLLAARGF